MGDEHDYLMRVMGAIYENAISEVRICSWFQVSAPLPAKKTAGLIEKETNER
ncbi:MAG: hypothetical protein KJP23_20405 [Deltaproteobacteria bacterium]|nr:hypothetical protein [Deltaproteobacteria bacterium]